MPTDFALSTADLTTVFGLVVSGLGVLWGYRKVIKTLNRS
jgi:hypothetical protein